MASGTQVSITEAATPEDLATVRGLFEEYASTLGQDLCFQGFAAELAGLPGGYARPDGRLLLALVSGQVAGCVALRRLDVDTGEMKRLYVRSAFRGLGLGRRLAETIAAEALAAGYRRMRLDTLPSMVSALSLYRQLGFHEIEPYRENPVEGAVFLELQLDRSSSDA